MKILFSYVGKQDPVSDKTNQEGSIVTLCREIMPDVVYIFPTADGLGVQSSTQENAENTRYWLRDEVSDNIKVYIKPLDLIDPTDYKDILSQTRKAVNKLLSCWPDAEYEVHLNTSSGTPQMKTAWMLLANAGCFPNCHLWQVSDPQYVKGNRVTRLEISFLEEENSLIRLQRYSKHYLFGQMADECLKLKELSSYSYRRDKAALIYKIFNAYNKWDLIFYQDAYLQLSSVLADVAKAKDLVGLQNLLERQVKVLFELKQQSEKESVENLLDLYFNAKRCFARSNYTDTLARFWRVYEGALYRCLRHNHGIEPTGLVKSKNQDNYNKLIAFAKANPDKLNPRALSVGGIWQAETLLNEVFKNSIYKRFIQQTVEVQRSNSVQKISVVKTLSEIRNKRNVSIVAHGMRPVSREDAENSIMLMQMLLETMLNTKSDITDYPFQEADINPVLQVLNSVFAY